MPHADLRCSALSVGGAGVARGEDGRVVFVEGALPGELVRAVVTDVRRRFARGVVEEVVEPSPDRVAPPCPHVARGCGGCGWQHLAVAAQRTAKVDLVADSLRRLGGVEDPVVHQGVALPTAGFRTTLRMAVSEGRAGFRRARSHDVVTVADCLVAHPLLAELVEEGRFGEAREVTLRAGASTGERIAVVAPTAQGVALPDGVVVVGADELARGRRAWIHEEVAGRRWRVSAESFFQTRADGAAVLVDEVAAAVAPVLEGLGSEPTLADLCCGVGLLGGAVVERLAGAGERRWSLRGVERSRSSVADARHNLADLEGAKVVRSSLERWHPSPADVVVADPARTGLGAAGVERATATGATTIVLVSCDPASLGRDTALLNAGGYRFASATLVDLFPHTAHVEVVSSFRRGR